MPQQVQIFSHVFLEAPCQHVTACPLHDGLKFVVMMMIF